MEDIQINGVYLWNTDILMSPLFCVYYSVHPALLASSRNSPLLFGELRPPHSNVVLGKTNIILFATEVGPGNGNMTQSRPIRIVPWDFFELELRQFFSDGDARKIGAWNFWEHRFIFGEKVSLRGWEKQKSERMRKETHEWWRPCPSSLISVPRSLCAHASLSHISVSCNQVWCNVFYLFILLLIFSLKSR